MNLQKLCLELATTEDGNEVIKILLYFDPYIKIL